MLSDHRRSIEPAAVPVVSLRTSRPLGPLPSASNALNPEPETVRRPAEERVMFLVVPEPNSIGTPDGALMNNAYAVPSTKNAPAVDPFCPI